MRIERFFSKAGVSPYLAFDWRETASEIRNPDGSTVFRQDGIRVPGHWSQVACDVLAQKYFRKAGIPAVVVAVPEAGVPEWLQRRQPDTDALAARPEPQRYRG